MPEDSPQSQFEQEAHKNMWDFLFGYFFGRATGIWRIVRPLLWLFLIGVIVCGFIYAYVVFHAVSERSQDPHVHTHSTH